MLRIKHLLLVDGLTLAGARRRLDEETAPVAAESPAIDELIGQNARERLTAVKRGLRSILELLAGSTGGDEFQLAPPVRALPPACGRCRPSARNRRAARRRRRGTDRRALPRRAAIDRRRIDPSGRSVAWLSRLTGGQEIGSSNPPVPTNFHLRSWRAHSTHISAGNRAAHFCAVDATANCVIDDTGVIDEPGAVPLRSIPILG